jgi:hypothetical protein
MRDVGVTPTERRLLVFKLILYQESRAGDLSRAERLQGEADIWGGSGTALAGENGKGSGCTLKTLSQSRGHQHLLRNVAVADTIAGTEAPGCGCGDVDRAGHGVVDAGGSELSLRSGCGRRDRDGLERMTVTAATCHEDKSDAENG